MTGCNKARISNDHCFAETLKEGEPRLVDKSLERIELGVDQSEIEGGDANDMALATSSLCNIFFGRSVVVL